jgi:sarcosine oxidase gamma subunit
MMNDEIELLRYVAVGRGPDDWFVMDRQTNEPITFAPLSEQHARESARLLNYPN